MRYLNLLKSTNGKMTRKKYERDTYYEELEEALASTSESESEDGKISEEEKYNILEQYLEYEIDIYWVRRWISACDLYELMTEVTKRSNVRAYAIDYDDYKTCQYLRNLIRHMCISTQIPDTVNRVEHVLTGLLRIRNKFEIILPRDQTHWTRRMHRNITRQY